MIKNVLLAAAALTMVAAPISAEARERDRGHRSEQHERKRGGGCGWLCGAIIGGVVVGVLSDSDRRDRDRRPHNPDYSPYRDYDNRYYPPDYRYDRRYCVREQITEWRRGERYVYWETTCN